ncbi:hypothetical protein CYMTET_50029 [Cymbomonas tetramitiformis]|uniref:Uncharacterized protein n=1 Tax=Cymbomonas tetramitiformis TaxID=36881 RepID=A0AAE0BP34_9CHLO|nr:hypothetical protein CYMTET_50029 [Cymbomonas tetramitiformis]
MGFTASNMLQPRPKRASVMRDIVHHYHSRPTGTSAAGAVQRSSDDFSTDDVGTFGSSDDCEDDSQNPPGYWDESDFDDENDESQNPPGYWDESDLSEEEYFSESAVSLPHLGVSQSSSAPLEPGVHPFEEPADDSLLREDDVPISYEQSEAWDDEANDDYETAEGGYTAAEWEAWEASHGAHEHVHEDHPLYQSGPEFSDVSTVGGQTDCVDYYDSYGDYGASNSGGAYGYDDGG